MTERHCWHPDRLLRRLWPSTSRKRQKGEGLLKGSAKTLAELEGHSLFPAWQSSSHSHPSLSPGPGSHTSTAATAQVFLESPPRTLPPFTHPDPTPQAEHTHTGGGCWGAAEGPSKEGLWAVRGSTGMC